MELRLAEKLRCYGWENSELSLDCRYQTLATIALLIVAVDECRYLFGFQIDANLGSDMGYQEKHLGPDASDVYQKLCS